MEQASQTAVVETPAACVLNDVDATGRIELKDQRTVGAEGDVPMLKLQHWERVRCAQTDLPNPIPIRQGEAREAGSGIGVRFYHSLFEPISLHDAHDRTTDWIDCSQQIAGTPLGEIVGHIGADGDSPDCAMNCRPVGVYRDDGADGGHRLAAYCLEHIGLPAPVPGRYTPR